MNIEFTQEEWKELQKLLEDYRDFYGDTSYAIHLADFIYAALKKKLEI